jgi:hypothetical protein
VSLIVVGEGQDEMSWISLGHRACSARFLIVSVILTSSYFCPSIAILTFPYQSLSEKVVIITVA